MVVIITGASHCGKTLVSQRLMEKLRVPYLSVDHLKMGLVRSGVCPFPPRGGGELAPYLWNITAGIVETAVENRQNLIVEGCYVPAGWQDRFSGRHLADIRCFCLAFTDGCIRERFPEILRHADAIERRLDDSDFTEEKALEENARFLREFSRKSNFFTSVIRMEQGFDAGAVCGRILDKIIRRELTCRTFPPDTLDERKYVVVCSFHKGKFLLSRHRDRATWETQGGKVEPGESLAQAARRELFEEAGVTDAELFPLCDYRARSLTGEDNGAVFCAEVRRLGSLPHSEMAEARPFPALPRSLTYPGVTPVLFKRADEARRTRAR